MVVPNSVCLLASGQVGFSDCQLSITGVFHYHQSSDKRQKNTFCADLVNFYAVYVSLLDMGLGFFFSSFILFLSYPPFLCRFSASYWAFAHCCTLLWEINNKRLFLQVGQRMQGILGCSILNRGCVVSVDRIIQKFYMHAAALTCR